MARIWYQLVFSEVGLTWFVVDFGLAPTSQLHSSSFHTHTHIHHHPRHGSAASPSDNDDNVGRGLRMAGEITCGL